MPVIIALIGGLLIRIFASLLNFFLTKFSVNLAIALAFLTLSVGFWVAFALAVNTALSGLYAVSPSWIAPAFDMFLPGNTASVLATMATVHLADFVFSIKRRLTFQAFAAWGGKA